MNGTRCHLHIAGLRSSSGTDTAVHNRLEPMPCSYGLKGHSTGDRSGVASTLPLSPQPFLRIPPYRAPERGSCPQLCRAPSLSGSEMLASSAQVSCDTSPDTAAQGSEHQQIVQNESRNQYISHTRHISAAINTNCAQE
jgi:hypothetical protein